MLKHFILITILFFCFTADAQKSDTLYVVGESNGWVIRHKVKAGETIFSIARHFYVPPAMLADVNKMNFQQQLQPQSVISIPTGAYNFLNAKPHTGEFRPLFVKVWSDGLPKIARTSNVSQKQLQDWNGLSNTEVRRGQILLVGWVRYDNTVLQTNQPVTKTTTIKPSGIKIEEDDFSNHRKPHTETIYITLPDTTKHWQDTLSEGEKQYAEQTFDGTNTVDEKGTAAFFKRAGRSTNGIYFAFHNLAKRGTILRIHNPGADKTVYAKVIGKLPVNGTFYNTILGISSDAKAELGTMSEKMWCEVSYAP